MTPGVMHSVRGSSSWCDNNTLKSKNSFDQIFAFIFCGIVEPRGIPSVTEIRLSELLKPLFVPTGSPVFSKS